MFYVSRQCYWPSGRYAVEVVAGGIDHANPDMLVAKFIAEGEGQEFLDPREAVEAAIRVCDAWRGSGVRCEIAVGATGGFTMPLEGMTFRSARAWAREAYERVPKCDGCGEALPSRHCTHAFCASEMRFCSETCAESALEGGA